MDGESLSLTIVIPTYKRIPSLIRCLESIENQLERPDKILVTVHSSDKQSLTYLQKRTIQFLEIKKAGVAAAISGAIEILSTDLVAFVDDDVTLPSHWVGMAKKSFQDSQTLGALGGTDRQPAVLLRHDLTVGKMTPYGKLIGNHHLATGTSREVDFLKGCNMVLRTSIATNYSPIFHLLRGGGAQVGVDLILSISSRIAGFNSVFNPDFWVFHHIEPRVDTSQRNELDEVEVRDLTFNLVLIKLTFSKMSLRGVVLVYQLIIGDREVPGVLRSMMLNKLSIRLIIRDLRNLLSVIQPSWKSSTQFRMPLPPRKKA